MFFLIQTLVIVVAVSIHILLDRSPKRRTAPRIVELVLVWLLAGGGAMAIVGGLGHIGPNSADAAAGIGYAPSMFQWELGWADIAFGVAGLVCIRKRDAWMSCAVTVISIGYLGDAVGHIMQYVAHDNTAPNNVWAIPSDILQPLFLIVLLVVHRHMQRKLQLQTAAAGPDEATTEAWSSAAATQQ